MDNIIPKSRFKAMAKELAKQREMKPTHAHEYLAKQLGFRTYNSYLAMEKKLNECS